MSTLEITPVLDRIHVCGFQRHRILETFGPNPKVTLRNIERSLEFHSWGHALNFWACALKWDNGFRIWIDNLRYKLIWNRKLANTPYQRQKQITKILAGVIHAYYKEWNRP